MRKVLYKLYLTLQGLTAVIGICFTLYHLAATPHDLYVSSKAKECAESLTNWRSVDSYDWRESFKYFPTEGEAKLMDNALNQKCGKYLRTYLQTSYSDNESRVNVYVNNWYDSDPAELSQRLSLLFSSFAVPAGLMISFYALMRWLRWLSQP